MSVIRTPRSARFLAAQIFLEIVLTLALLGLAGWVYTQSQTEHQICQAFEFFGQRTSQQISLNVAHLKADERAGNAAAVVLDRKAIADATDFLIRIDKVKC